ncbi:major facilitator superfamily transporter [Colletotrichum salicis]|uniref:Major facilitator superfamily transporter n=1 Tax=Colletotrichum salicis TaxID=1209931 RepID=A0A135V821_9PEZI|nr:major facilitator superfamily transporter [Colletotrichum salicis]
MSTAISMDNSAPSDVAAAEASASKNAPFEHPKADADAVAKAEEHIVPPAVQPLQLSDEPSASAPHTAPESIPPVYITGWRLYAIIFGLCMSLFLSTLGTTIVSTTLCTGLSSGTGSSPRFLVIFAKFSDVLGRKFVVLLSLAIFTIFSIVCGVISSMVQLIVFRALQGVGASGIYAMVNVINPELVPSDKWGNIVAGTSLVLVFSSVLGPVLGGVINDHSSWRWVFLLNAPTGAFATALLAFLLPSNFPHHGRGVNRPSMRDKFSGAAIARLDFVGAAVLLAASILLVFGFEEAGSRYPWTSPIVTSTIVCGGSLFLVFIRRGVAHLLCQNRLLHRPAVHDRLDQPPAAFPSRPRIESLCCGRSHAPSPLQLPLAAAVTGPLATKIDVPPFYLLLFGACMQILGVGLVSSATPDRLRDLLGFEVIMGFGFGMTLVTGLIYVPFLVDRRDLAVSMGAVTQFRTLGGTIGLALRLTILNNHLASSLPNHLTPSETQSISDSVQFIDSLPAPTRTAVRSVFSEGYNKQLRTMLYFSVAVLV